MIAARRSDGSHKRPVGQQQAGMKYLFMPLRRHNFGGGSALLGEQGIDFSPRTRSSNLNASSQSPLNGRDGPKCIDHSVSLCISLAEQRNCSETLLNLTSLLKCPGKNLKAQLRDRGFRLTTGTLK